MPNFTKLIVIICFINLVSCQHCSPPCYLNLWENTVGKRYVVNQDQIKITPAGFQYDNSEEQIFDPVELDRRLLLQQKCILDTITELGGYIKVEKEWYCLAEQLVPDIFYFKKECLIFKIVPAVYSECSNWQFIDVFAPIELCKAKGLEVNDKCPCRWRTTLQPPNTVITPPDLYLWETWRLISACGNLWNSPLGKCLTL